MKFLRIDRYHESKKIYAITIFKFRIELRRWYQLWTEKGEDLMYPEHEGWGKVWFSKCELDKLLWYDRVQIETLREDVYDYTEVKRDTPHDWKYRKMPLILTICEWRSLWYKYKRLLAGILIGFLLSLLIQH